MKSRNSLIYLVLAIILCLVLVKRFEILNYYSTRDVGMNASKGKGQDRFITSCLKKPSRLDIVVVKTKRYDKNAKIVSRLVGLPGDTLIIRKGVLFVNGENVDTLLGIIPTDTISSDMLVVGTDIGFLMGDNRKKSLDSRHYGQIDMDEIITTKL